MSGKGLFIVLEGVDGSGKTTLSNALRDSLTAIGYRVHVTAEPTDGTIGKLLRERRIDNGKAEALMFVADRACHTDDISSRREAGEVVICDRYYASTLAYQSAPLDGSALDIGWLKQLNDAVIVEPDITFLLDIDPESAIGRVDERGERSKFERLEYQKRVRANYLTLAEERGFNVLDASQKPADLQSQALSQIMEKLRR